MQDKNTMTSMNFRIDHSLRSEFQRAAKENDRNTSQLLRDFMRTYIDQNKGTQKTK